MAIKKIVLAYSGGLDTSIIIPWLKERYAGAEVIAYCGDTGQQDDLTGLEQRAVASGARELHLVDLKREFVTDFIFPMLRAGAMYEGKYLLGTAIARPLQAKHQVAVAHRVGADAVAHGCTGKGNDQVRFEMAYRALGPELAVIAPWRLWEISSREQAIDYAAAHGIALGGISRKNIYSRDDNLWHVSHEGGDLEQPSNRPGESLFLRSESPQSAPDREQPLQLTFQDGIPVALDGEQVEPVELLQRLNAVAGEHGVGRADLVETRLVGMKSRGVYETPGGTVLYAALAELESLTLDADALHYKQVLGLRYAELVYTGKWFTPLRDALDACVGRLCQGVNGTVDLALYKGNIITAGRSAPHSLYSQELASFSAGEYDHHDASGFIELYGLPTRVRALSEAKRR
jgi:argininosuccinate synthase